MEDRKTQALSALLEEDREQVMSTLLKDRSPEAALGVLEKETDRLMYRAGELQRYTGMEAEVQGMLQTVRNTLPLVESVSEVEVWEAKDSREHAAGSHPSLSAGSILSLFAGVVLICASLIGQSITSAVFRPGAVICSAAGAMLLTLGGWLAGRGKKEKKGSTAKTKYAYLVDPARVWHVMQGIILSAEHSLDSISENSAVQEIETDSLPPEIMDKSELSFFSELLEHAYTMRRRFPADSSMGEQVESIRYYLHTRGIETEDYSGQSEQWFSFLPSGGQVTTIRPAMFHDGTLIRKGLASK